VHRQCIRGALHFLHTGSAERAKQSLGFRVGWSRGFLIAQLCLSLSLSLSLCFQLTPLFLLLFLLLLQRLSVLLR
jgi:hypothetical protein